MNDCENREGMLSALFDGELGESEAEELRKHISDCERCREALGEYEALSDAIRNVEIPAGLHDGIMSAVRAEKRPQPRRRQTARAIFAIAACAVIVFGSVLALPSMFMGGMSGGMAEAPAGANNAEAELAVLETETEGALPEEAPQAPEPAPAAGGAEAPSAEEPAPEDYGVTFGDENTVELRLEDMLQATELAENPPEPEKTYTVTLPDGEAEVYTAGGRVYRVLDGEAYICSCTAEELELVLGETN